MRGHQEANPGPNHIQGKVAARRHDTEEPEPEQGENARNPHPQPTYPGPPTPDNPERPGNRLPAVRRPPVRPQPTGQTVLPMQPMGSHTSGMRQEREVRKVRRNS